MSDQIVTPSAKPCARCGKTPTHRLSDSGVYQRVGCDCCPSCYTLQPTLTEAIDTWNTLYADGTFHAQYHDPAGQPVTQAATPEQTVDREAGEPLADAHENVRIDSRPLDKVLRGAVCAEMKQSLQAAIDPAYLENVHPQKEHPMPEIPPFTRDYGHGVTLSVSYKVQPCLNIAGWVCTPSVVSSPRFDRVAVAARGEPNDWGQKPQRGLSIDPAMAETAVEAVAEVQRRVAFVDAVVQEYMDRRAMLIATRHADLARTAGPYLEEALAAVNREASTPSFPVIEISQRAVRRRLTRAEKQRAVHTPRPLIIRTGRFAARWIVRGLAAGGLLGAAGVAADQWRLGGRLTNLLVDTLRGLGGGW